MTAVCLVCLLAASTGGEHLTYCRDRPTAKNGPHLTIRIEFTTCPRCLAAIDRARGFTLNY